MTDIPPELIEKAARGIVERRGFCWVESPEDEGQDGYDICSDALDEARAALAAIWPDVERMIKDAIEDERENAWLGRNR